MKIDAHNHPDWHGHSFDRFIENMDRFGIDKTWLLAWECPADEYEPHTMAVFPSSLSNNYGSTNIDPIPFSRCVEYKQRAPERFILGFAPDPRRPGALDRLKSAVTIFGVQVCGELKLRMMYDNPDAIAMYRWCGENGLPVTLHFDYPIVSSRNCFPRDSWWYGGDIDTLERMLMACPETNFLGHAPGFWAHISNDDLGKTTGYPKGPVIPGGRIEQLLDKYPNLYCDCSAGSCHNALSRDVEYTKKLIMAHPDRFLYARDYFDNKHRELFDSLGLPESVLEMIYHENAERIVGPLVPPPKVD